MNETFDSGLLLASLGLKRCIVSGSLLPEGHKARKGNQGRAQHRQRHGYLQNGKLDYIKNLLGFNQDVPNIPSINILT